MHSILLTKLSTINVVDYINENNADMVLLKNNVILACQACNIESVKKLSVTWLLLRSMLDSHNLQAQNTDAFDFAQVTTSCLINSNAI